MVSRVITTKSKLFPINKFIFDESISIFLRKKAGASISFKCQFQMTGKEESDIIKQL